MNEKNRVIQQFGKNAAHYVSSQTHAKGEDLKKMIEIIKRINPPGELLDIATGSGHVANALAPYFKQVVALDLTSEMLEKAQWLMSSNGIRNVAFVNGDAENLPFPEESVGTVTCRIAAHHFPNVELFLTEVIRVLKEKGLFLLVDNVAPEKDRFDLFYNRIEKRRDPSHVHAFKKSEWISMLENKGFIIEEMYMFKKRFIFETWCKLMDVPQREKQAINTMMISSTREIVDYFSIKAKDKEVESFNGQSVLFVARKM